MDTPDYFSQLLALHAPHRASAAANADRWEHDGCGVSRDRVDRLTADVLASTLPDDLARGLAEIDAMIADLLARRERRQNRFAAMFLEELAKRKAERHPKQDPLEPRGTDVQRQ